MLMTQHVIDKMSYVATKWGWEHQTRLLMEESGELIQAINKEYRARQMCAPYAQSPEDIKPEDRDDVYEEAFLNLLSEMADVENVLNQLKILMGHGIDSRYEKIFQYKVDRAVLHTAPENNYERRYYEEYVDEIVKNHPELAE